MDWTDRTRELLEVALNECDVVGVRHSEGMDEVRVLLHVAALPETGPMDPDRRRTLVFHGVPEVRVVLRTCTVDGHGPAIPLADLDGVESFFDSLTIGGSMYGWRFFDDPELTDDWPDVPSLLVVVSGHGGPHTFYWFNECARNENGELRSYCIEGTIGFATFSVLRADGPEQTVEEFIAEGVRWWQALQDGDPRVNTDAQLAPQRSRLAWRGWSRVRAE